MGQEVWSSLRSKEIIMLNDTIQLDTLSIAPSTLSILDENNEAIQITDYQLDFASGLLVMNSEKHKGKKLKVRYRVFPLNFSKDYSHKDTSLIIDQINFNRRNKVFIIQEKKRPAFGNQLDKNGTISRGFTMGNQRDLGTLSDLNLQLAGKLNNEVSILAAISDNNMPIQPEGNTQKLQEFDKVYIKLYTKNSSVRLGDIEMEKPKGYFLNLKKQTRGISFYHQFENKKKLQLTSKLNAGMAKGKYNRIKMNGIEGNQGPYRLLGTNNESYIIVLSGSEKVYINGELLTRGEKFDYVIDYNTAEVIFTANRPITKDSRIIIEFEYAQQFFPRMQFLQSNYLKGKKADFWFNFYLEQDNKNDPLLESYNDETKSFLSTLGDSTHKAIIPNFRKVDYSNDKVLYQLKDSIHNDIVYDSVFVHSIEPALAIYQVGFTYVGQNEGNYQPAVSSANGKVYKWVAPVNGVKQGAYEPVTLFITPQKHIVSNFGGSFKTSANGKADFEIAVSNFDVNTFSPADGKDNIGYAVKLNTEQFLFSVDTNKAQMKLYANYQLVNNNFRAVENYKQIEYERDWNLLNQQNFGQEQLIGAGVFLKKADLGFINSSINYLQRADRFDGKKAQVSSQIDFKGFKLLSSASYLLTDGNLQKTNYLKHHIDLSKQFRFLRIGLSEETEDNKWHDLKEDTLMYQSFKFNEYAAYIMQSDSSINEFYIRYKYRQDFIPERNFLKEASSANTYQAGFSLKKNKYIKWKTAFTFRDLINTDSIKNENIGESYISGRQEISLRLAKGGIALSGFYETGSGLEQKRQYQYIEVQAGQGQYTWIDYNDNNMKELDEFELAKFTDEADHIRIFVPSNEYLRAYSTQISTNLSFLPARIWKGKSIWEKALSMFSNQASFRIRQKSENENFLPNLNEQEGLLSQAISLRNSLSFRTLNRNWQFAYLYENNITNSLMVNGIDKRELESNTLKTNWFIKKSLMIWNIAVLGVQKFNSEFFSSKDYRINIQSNESGIQLQAQKALSTTLSYKHTLKENFQGGEKAFLNETKITANQKIAKRISILGDLSYVKIDYRGDNSSISYEMLDGLKNGDNIVWNLRYDHKLSKIFNLSIGYNGRTAEKSNVIHNGSVQLRAGF